MKLTAETVLTQPRPKPGSQLILRDNEVEIALHHFALRWQGRRKIVGKIMDVERLREPIERISNRLMELMCPEPPYSRESVALL